MKPLVSTTVRAGCRVFQIPIKKQKTTLILIDGHGTFRFEKTTNCRKQSFIEEFSPTIKIYHNSTSTLKK